jgi:hypothetical protein
MDAWLKKLEVNWEKLEAVAKHQEVSNEKAAEENIGALEDWSEDQCLAVRHCRWLTHHAVPAQHKGCSHKGLTIKNRRQAQPRRNNGIRDRSLKQKLQLGSKEMLMTLSGRLSCWRLWSEQLGLLSGFKKWVSSHCGGAGHRPSTRRDYPQQECQRCRSSGHFQKFCLHWPKRRNGSKPLGYSGQAALRRGQCDM